MSVLWRPPESPETDLVRVRDVHNDIVSCGAFWERSLQWCVVPIERLHILDITTQIHVVNSPRETSIPLNTQSSLFPWLSPRSRRRLGLLSGLCRMQQCLGVAGQINENYALLGLSQCRLRPKHLGF